MKKFLLIIIFFVTSKTLINGQVAEQHKLNINVSTGLVKLSSNDQLLNYFNYKGRAFLPISLKSYYCCQKNLFFFKIYYNNAKLYPNLNNNYYKYNYIKQWNTEISLEYYRQVVQINKYIQAFIGAANNSYLILQQEYYNNLLYDYAKGYKKSYDISLINLSPNLLINFNLHKNNFVFKTGYTLINYAARPDDNYVKQIGLNNKFNWKLYLPKDYTSIQFSLFYQYNLTKKMGITAEYNVQYHSYSSPSEYKYLRRLYLVGISKSF